MHTIIQYTCVWYSENTLAFLSLSNLAVNKSYLALKLSSGISISTLGIYVLMKRLWEILPLFILCLLSQHIYFYKFKK